eukprot:gene2189-biopygen11340
MPLNPLESSGGHRRAPSSTTGCKEGTLKVEREDVTRRVFATEIELESKLPIPRDRYIRKTNGKGHLKVCGVGCGCIQRNTGTWGGKWLHPALAGILCDELAGLRNRRRFLSPASKQQRVIDFLSSDRMHQDQIVS